MYPPSDGTDTGAPLWVIPLFILVAKSSLLPPLTLTLSPRWGERGQEERTFGKRYMSSTGYRFAASSTGFSTSRTQMAKSGQCSSHHRKPVQRSALSLSLIHI